MLTAVYSCDRAIKREFLRCEKKPAAVTAKNAARNPHRIPVSVRLPKVLPATTKITLPNASRMDGHSHPLNCDNRTMDKTIGMNVTAASRRRLQLLPFNTGVNRMAISKDRRSIKSGRDVSLLLNEKTSTTCTCPR